LRRQSRQSRALWRAVPRWPCSSTCKIADAISSRGLPRMKGHEDGGNVLWNGGSSSSHRSDQRFPPISLERR